MAAQKTTDNDVSLKEYLGGKIDALEKQVDTIFALHKIALEKSEKAMLLEIQHMNDKFVTKPELAPIKAIVYGMVGTILLAFLGALVALVVIR